MGLFLFKQKLNKNTVILIFLLVTMFVFFIYFFWQTLILELVSSKAKGYPCSTTAKQQETNLKLFCYNVNVVNVLYCFPVFVLFAKSKVFFFFFWVNTKYFYYYTLVLEYLCIVMFERHVVCLFSFCKDVYEWVFTTYYVFINQIKTFLLQSLLPLHTSLSPLFSCCCMSFHMLSSLLSLLYHSF